MKINTYISALLLFGFIGCKENNKQNPDQAPKEIITLLMQAANNYYSLKERLSFALKADSISIIQNNKHEHLNSTRLIATIYLQENETGISKNYFFRNAMLSKELSDQESLAIALNNLGLIYNEECKYDSAIQFFVDAQVIFRRLGQQKWIAENFIDLGISYEHQSLFEQAFKADLEAVKILDTLKDKDDLSSAYLSLGDVVNELKRFDDALYYYQFAFQFLKEINDSIGMAYALNNSGNSYRSQKNYRLALRDYFSALKIKERINNPRSLAVTVDNIAEVYFELKDYNNAEANFKKALELRHLSGDMEGFITTSNRLSNLYIEINEIRNAETVALKAFMISPPTGLLKKRLENNLILFNIYKKSKKFELAINYANKAFELKDSLFNTDMVNAIIQMNTKYKTEEKDKELLHSKQLQEIQFNQINIQKNFIIMLIFSLVLFSFLMFLLYRSNKMKNKANLRIETLMHELNHRVKNNLQLILDMLNLQKNNTNDKNHIAIIQSSINRIHSISIIHTLLYKEGFHGTIDMKDFMEDLVSNLTFAFQSPSISFKISTEIQNHLININKAIPIGIILNELITNIYKYAKQVGGKATLEIKFFEKNNIFELEIKDNCEYWNINDARERKKGLGLFLVETLIQQLNASWNFVSNDKGTTHCITFSI